MTLACAIPTVPLLSIRDQYLTDAIYTTVELPYAAASARDAAVDYCLSTPLRLEIEFRTPGEAELVTQATVAALERRFGTGPIVANMRAYIVAASG